MMKDVLYDNRFGFAKYCKAFWRIDSDRVGEQFRFQFPNGIEVSVIRNTCWDYGAVIQNLSTASSYGFYGGMYEAMIRRGNVELDQEGYLDYKAVQKLLSKYRNYN